MTQIKSNTDLEQSKKLAEILPPESADMKWFFWKEEIDAPKLPTFGYSKTAAESYKDTEATYLPCWSIASLFKLMPSVGVCSPVLVKSLMEDKYCCHYHGIGTYKEVHTTFFYDEIIDACVEMILKLHELNLL